MDNGQLIATQEVLEELKKKDDELLHWVQRHSQMVIPLDDAIQLKAREILRTHRKLIDTRSGRSAADPFVIALADLNHAKVITQERATNSPNRPNIPDVCRDYGVPCLNLLELCREQKWVFES